ncbi:MAG: sigma-54 dependent transcriptional regulator [Thermodesulfobacteriota bacterium]
MQRRILVVDDDAPMRAFLTGVLREEGYVVEEAGGGQEALARLRAAPFDLVLTDLRMPDLTGLDLLAPGRVARPEARWVLITAYGSIGSAVEAMKAGAADYLTKPLRSPDELRHVVRRVLREAEAEEKIEVLSEELGRSFPPLETVFCGEAMQAVRQLVVEVAPTTTTVLVTGPTGTGKELVARAIHGLSARRLRPFVAVHCAALAESVLESELFGHERGAYTGAVASRKGRFELAHGGTLFLDEVGDIPLAIQVKLLRVLQEREIERVGGAGPVATDVRIISATNQDLRAAMAAGRFREDLFYRLNVFPIAIPPLAWRRDAILPLAQYFVVRSAAACGKPPPALTGEAGQALAAYAWPGNVRELQNVIERAVILAGSTVLPRHLNLEPMGPGEGAGRLQASERETIVRVLSEVGGNRRQAAELLGISLRTLQYRIKEYGL